MRPIRTVVAYTSALVVGTIEFVLYKLAQPRPAAPDLKVGSPKWEIEAVGGPLDGLRRPFVGHLTTYMWIDEGKCYQVPGPGRHLYTRANTIRPKDDRKLCPVYRFVGDTHTQCAGCGAFHALTDKCQLCGAALVRR